MLKQKIFFFIICIISAYSFNLREAKQSYDSYVFGLQWPNGYCGGNNSCDFLKKTEKNILTIHGLWPSLKSGKSLADCASGQSVPDGNSSLFNQMRKYWFSIKGSNKDFWQHEYNKHGYCMVQEKRWKGYEDYFNFALKLYLNRYKNLLINSFGNPHKVLELDVSELKSKIQKVMPGANFKLKCDSKKYITEFHFYLEKNLSPNTNARLSNGSCNKAKLVFK